MRLNQQLWAVVACGITLASCREADKPVGPTGNARIEINSDPVGAQIILDGVNTGKVTPDLLRDLSTATSHEILVRLDDAKDNVTYGFRVAGLQAKGDSLIRINGPLTMRCTTSECSTLLSRYNTLNTIRVSTVPNGALFNYNNSNKGLYYPTGFSNGYVSMGLPVVAMLAGTRDTLAMGPYDVNYLAGRPMPDITQTSDRYSLKQSFWIVPPSTVISTNAPTARGIEVKEELIGVTATADVAFVKLTFTNITNTALYQAVDPIVPSGGITYNWVYLGFALDPDIGEHLDDIITYDPQLNMVYAYDADFSEPQFSPGYTDKPALVGLRILEAPANATVKALNAWPSASDFRAGEVSERNGWYMLSGVRSMTPDFAGQQIGFTPTAPDDYRMSVTAGPITLAPGASASITVAVIIALPTPGTFTPGQYVDPGNPTVANRKIALIAAGLLDKARSLVVPQ